MTLRCLVTAFCSLGVLLAAPVAADEFQWAPVQAGSQTPTVVTTQAHPAPPADPRVRAILFRENDVVRVDTKLRLITAIEFAAGETVKAVLAGDTKSFEIVRLKSGNVISIKPLVRRARTNVNIYTDRRTYVLDVREGRRKRLTHRLRFDYPPPPPKEAALIAAGVIPGPDHASDYKAAGDADFRPIAAWDDGTATYFRFARGAQRPAIFWSDEDGADYATNAAQIDSETVKIPLIRTRWTLRIGSDVVCVVKGAREPGLVIAVAGAEEAHGSEVPSRGRDDAQQ